MTADDSHTRRDCLRTVSAAGAVAGSALFGVSSASAQGWPPGRGPGGIDPANVCLEAACVDAERDAALFCVENDNDRPALLEWTTAPVEEGVYFLDCQTVRVVGDFAEVMISAAFETDAGIGDVFHQFGAVDGSAVFDVTDPDHVPDDSIVMTVDAFREGTVVVPGGGDISVGNPNYEACQEEVFGEVIDGAASGAADGADSASGNAGSESDDESGRLIVPPDRTRCFTVSAPDGLTTVELRDDGAVIDTASSAAADACSGPIRWRRRGRD